MTEPAFPVQHTTTTTVTSSSTTVQTDIRYDPNFVRTVPGILKCIQIFLNLLIFLIVSFSVFSYVGSMSFMSFISGLGFWLTGISLGCYVFHIVEKFYQLPWLKVELIYDGVWTLFLLVGSTICASNMGYGAVFGAVAFFGFINMIVYGYDGFVKFKAIQNGEIAQGSRQVVKSSNTSPVMTY